MKTLYKDIKKHIKPFKGDTFEVEHFKLSKEKVELEKMKSMFNGSYGEVHSLKAGAYIKLTNPSMHEIVMSDTPMELETNRLFVEEAKGVVLIGGLGLGIVLLAIQSKKEVKRVVIIEKEKELIEKIGKQLPLNKKVELVHADIFEFKTNEKFDTIYFDIWSHISSDNYEDMKLLHKKFRKNLNKEGWMSSWRFEYCKELKYKENRESRMWPNF